VAQFTAVIVVIGSSLTHSGPVVSALYRVLEVVLGGMIGLDLARSVFQAHGARSDGSVAFRMKISRVKRLAFFAFVPKWLVRRLLEPPHRVNAVDLKI
jgi:hypothetical protein